MTMTILRWLLAVVFFVAIAMAAIGSGIAASSFYYDPSLFTAAAAIGNLLVLAILYAVYTHERDTAHRRQQQ